MNRFRIRHRRSAAVCLVVAGLLAPATLTGCGTGQIAQTTDQKSAVNGTAGAVGEVALRDVRLQAVQTGDSVPAGTTVDLVFVASNQSVQETDELTSISTDIGKVSLTGARKLPIGGVLIVAAPATADPAAPPTLKELHAVEDANTAMATVTLDRPISNGLTYGFTFEFKQAGKLSLEVPISAQGAAPRPHH